MTSNTTADRSKRSAIFGYDSDDRNVMGNRLNDDQVPSMVETRESHGRMMDWGNFVSE